ncbi:bis(5'-nucleosyl)-tetraphosphatase (symmetrical) YqeK [Candidatus Clostridium radicumherbarum]|uniref:bis(5'-nucleosyl)-tetraphosphatase (symmetrical) n=1 Tax=Candidatus Clostridium radicumherbarum TaxID=3381662 RepID=A0ABW8TT22_9CLOT
MWSEDQITDYLKANLNPQRFQHSIRVMETAVSLAKRYKVDEEKAKLAGLTHDCAKNLNNLEINDLLVKNGYNIDMMFKKSSNVMHGLAGSIIARDVMGISDEEVLNAIVYHTTGRANMSMLEKIIYIADYIEPMRNFEGIATLRTLAYENLDEALLLSFNNTIKYVIDKAELIHKDTIEARNFILFTKH